MHRRPWIVVMEHLPGESKPTVRYVVNMGEPRPHNIDELRDFLIAGTIGLPKDIKDIPHYRLDSGREMRHEEKLPSGQEQQKPDPGGSKTA